MAGELSGSARKVQEALAAVGLPLQVLKLPQTARSAVEAAAAIGCGVDQIAKSLVFKGRHTEEPVLVIASGANRVDEKRISGELAEQIERADADYVRQRTGFAIGGVAPVGHRGSIRTFIDEDLFQHAEIWAAAGAPDSVFKLAPADLVRMTGGTVLRVKTGV